MSTSEIVAIAGIALVSVVSLNVMTRGMLSRLEKVNNELKEKIRTLKDAEQQLRHTLDRYEIVHRPVRTTDQKELDKEYLARIDEQIKAERKREEERLIRPQPAQERRRGDHLRTAWPTEQDRTDNLPPTTTIRN